MVAADVPARGVQIAGLGDHLEPGLGAEQLLEPAADDGVIVGDHDPDRPAVLERLRAVLVVGPSVSARRVIRRSAIWSSCWRYGARYWAAIFVGGDQVGASLISELEP